MSVKYFQLVTDVGLSHLSLFVFAYVVMVFMSQLITVAGFLLSMYLVFKKRLFFFLTALLVISCSFENSDKNANFQDF